MKIDLRLKRQFCQVGTEIFYIKKVKGGYLCKVLRKEESKFFSLKTYPDKEFLKKEILKYKEKVCG